MPAPQPTLVSPSSSRQTWKNATTFAPGPNVPKASSSIGVVEPFEVLFAMVQIIVPPGDTFFPWDVGSGPQSELEMPAGSGSWNGPPELMKLPGPVRWTWTGRLKPPTAFSEMFTWTEPPSGILSVVCGVTNNSGTPI